MGFIVGKKRVLFRILFVLLAMAAMYLVVLDRRAGRRSTPADMESTKNTSRKKIVYRMKKAGIQPIDGSALARDFVLPDVEGRLVRLSGQRGKVVLLHFWATWCPECRKEMPVIENVHRHFQGRDFVVLAIDIKESAKRVRKYLSANSLTFTSLLDTQGKVSTDAAIRFIPTTLLIDKDGTLLGKAVGPRNWYGRRIMGVLEDLVAATQASARPPEIHPKVAKARGVQRQGVKGEASYTAIP